MRFVKTLSIASGVQVYTNSYNYNDSIYDFNVSGTVSATNAAVRGPRNGYHSQLAGSANVSKWMVIDLGTDVTEHPWKKDGDLWTSNGPLLKREPVIAGQTAGLFVEEVPISIPRDVAAEVKRCPAGIVPGGMLQPVGEKIDRMPGNDLIQFVLKMIAAIGIAVIAIVLITPDQLMAAVPAGWARSNVPPASLTVALPAPRKR
jgi:hypothetical protein